MTDVPPEEPPADPRDALVRVQAERIAALEATVADLREQRTAAERSGSRNSGNSSMPPSSDDLPGRKPPRKQRRAAERAEKKKRGSSRAARARLCGGRPRTGPRTTIPRALEAARARLSGRVSRQELAVVGASRGVLHHSGTRWPRAWSRRSPRGDEHGDHGDMGAMHMDSPTATWATGTTGARPICTWQACAWAQAQCGGCRWRTRAMTGSGSGWTGCMCRLARCWGTGRPGSSCG